MPLSWFGTSFILKKPMWKIQKNDMLSLSKLCSMCHWFTSTVFVWINFKILAVCVKWLLIKLAPLVLSLRVLCWAEASDTDVWCGFFQACSTKCLNVSNLPEKTWSDLFISLTWFRVYYKSSSYFCKLERQRVLPANLVLVNWYRGCLFSLWKSSYCILYAV